MDDATTPQPDRLSLPDHAAPKRLRTAYDEQEVASILGAVSGGRSLRRACADHGIDHSTFLRWVRDDEPAGLANQYARAREQQAHALADGIVDIAMDEGAKADPNLLRVRLDAAKWAAARILPKVYGDRIDVNQTSNVNVRVGWVIDLTPDGQGASPVIEGQAVEALSQPESGDE